MNLRPYQAELKKNIYTQFRSGIKSVLAQLATGGGKTIIFSDIIKDGFFHGKRVLIMAHRKELIIQASTKLYDGFGIDSGIIKSGIQPHYERNVQVGSVQTLINRLDDIGIFDLIIIDEAHHHQGKNTYGKIIKYLTEKNPDCKILGVTATPCRSNGAGFKNVYDNIVLGPSINDLIKLGFLTTPKYYVTPIDLSDIKISAGDYNQKDLAEKYIQRVPPASLVANYKKVANGLRCIGFAANIEHSKDIVECFNSNGIPAAHVDGTTPEFLRNQAVNDFENGKILYLSNVGVFDEGFDLPAIEAVQLARPTKSLIKFMQMVGRALRTVEGKKYALVLDHAGVVTEHGPVEFERRWTIEGVSKETEQKFAYKNKETGEIYEPKQLPLNIDADNIELIELRIEDIVKRRLKKVKTDVIKKINFAKYKSYNPKWAWHQLAERVTGIDYEETEKKLLEIADVYCEIIGHKPGAAYYLVKNKMEEKYKKQKETA